MQNFTPIKSILFIAIAGVIVYFYAIPKVSIIGNNQDQQGIFSEELRNVSSVNSDLAQKLSERDAISPQDRQTLMNFLPSEIDEVKILKDLEFIISSAGIQLEEVSSEGDIKDQLEQKEGDVNPIEIIKNQFSVKFTASYNELKLVLLSLENNSYVFQVSDLVLNPTDDGLLTVSMSLDVFSRSLNENNTQITQSNQ